MAYEASKDKVLFTAGEVEAEKCTYVVEVVSYNGGPVKVSVTERGGRFVKAAGRIPVEYAAEIAKLYAACAEFVAKPKLAVAA